MRITEKIRNMESSVILLNVSLKGRAESAGGITAMRRQGRPLRGFSLLETFPLRER